ncbi:nitroreductase family protein [Propionispora hippei]|uniref:Nitroreductase n=1 Tax=Propionispora hippei DSM 15287 TaxID=1123003 RepID=A0A1M6P3R6_9FIRM|nr:nitroreductase family protein [Propionispora hippei]SHK02550.1 Nitroreductase [Propionispora hippei DSM 15287]
MFDNINEQHSKALDDIVKARRTVRAFSPDAPRKEDIKSVIQAGLIAPFGALAVAGKSDFRKVIVIPNSSTANVTAASIIQSRFRQFADELEKKIGLAPFVQNLRRVAQQGVPGIGNAPYYIVVGERKGTPPVAAQSISYCLHTMWLKATSLGIGFQLVSATIQMDSDPEFCKLLGLSCGDYALDGCALGYPAENYEPPHVDYPVYDKSVAWL